ncbi:hypothetical protein C8J56DRAFT_1054038 [Mycena floridula]|nr:hypothetical protein C8J56DRAFT_1054038 [Mycena floridula]
MERTPPATAGPSKPSACQLGKRPVSNTIPPPSSISTHGPFATPAVPETAPFDYPLRVNGRFATESQFARANRVGETPLVRLETPDLASAFSTPAPRNQPRERAADASVHGSAMRSMGSPLLPTTSSQFNMLFHRQSSPAPLPPTHQAPSQGPAPTSLPFQPVQPVLSDEDRCRERDWTHPDIRAIQLNGSTWPSTTKSLSLMGQNWSSWKRALENVLNINGQLALHVFEAQVWSCPDHDLYPTSAINWLVNDRAVMGFIKSKVMLEEYATTDNPDLDTAWKLFNALEM